MCTRQMIAILRSPPDANVAHLKVYTSFTFNHPRSRQFRKRFRCGCFIWDCSILEQQWVDVQIDLLKQCKLTLAYK